MKGWLLAALLLTAASARATTIVGTNYNGLPLSPTNGDVLSGTFINVSSFTLAAGATVFVSPSDSLAIYASTIAVYGTLDGSGRGQPGGGGGPSGAQGTPGFAAATNGGGNGGPAGEGGGGGAGDASGGKGAGTSLTPGGTGYLTVINPPVSAGNSVQGSGGGGGGGDNSKTGGAGAAGGAAIYLEASSVTIAGTINASGASATPVTDAASGTHPGGGGGGGGGTILLRVTGALSVTGGARLQADGGAGGNVDLTLIAGALEPGGGGGGGRIRIFTPAASYGSITLSTAAGAAGGKDTNFSGTVDATTPSNAGGVGEVRFGTVAVSPTALAIQGLTSTSITYSWTATSQFGDGANPTYRLFPFTSTAPLSGPDATSASSPKTIGSLTPNTTYYRFVTAYTDWGDSAPSNAVSTHTLADVPGAAAAPFSSMADTSLTASWTAGASGNPSYTVYEVDRSSDPAFGLAVSTSFAVGLSSSPSGLLPNTSYYLRVRAINLDNVPSAYATTLTTATLATPPSSPALGTVFVTSVSFAWAQGANPSDTRYQAQVSSDNFFSIAATSNTLGSSATFFSLTPGTQYYLRVFALNREGLATAFSTVISTSLGNLSNTTPPSDPGTPAANVRFSYDGAAIFTWSPAMSPVGILGYNLIIGSTPGGNDIANINPTSLTGTQYSASGLPTGQTIYARVRAESNAGVFSNFSGISAGLPVFITSQSSPFAKPINWPNPFDPSQGPTQIGVSLDSAADVKLRIFTLQGRLVHEQTFSFTAGGNQILTWDGRNDSGARVAPGGYVTLVEKRYGSHTETQRLKIAVLY